MSEQHETTTAEEEAADAELRLRHARGVHELFTTRDDLRGVHAHADFVVDSVRWCA